MIMVVTPWTDLLLPNSDSSAIAGGSRQTATSKQVKGQRQQGATSRQQASKEQASDKEGDACMQCNVLVGHFVAIAPCAAATTAAPKSTILLLPVLLLLAVLLIPLLPLLLLLLTPLLRQLVSAASSAHSATTAAHPVLAYLPHSPRPCLPLAWPRPSLPSSGSLSPCLPHAVCVSPRCHT